jgi:hypothetical protein
VTRGTVTVRGVEAQTAGLGAWRLRGGDRRWAVETAQAYGDERRVGATVGGGAGMQNRSRSIGTDRDPDPAGLDRYAGDDDCDAFVVCDRRDARAWVRSETVVSLDS